MNERIDTAALLSGVDIVGVIDRYVPLKKNGSEFEACCPFHSEKTPSFKVSPAKQFYNCFGCGANGDAIKFLQEHQGLSFKDAVSALGGSLPAQADRGPAQRQPVREEKKRIEWKVIMPVPLDAPEFPKAHSRRGKPEMFWQYKNAAGRLLGVIYRFKTSDGGKEVLPCVYAAHPETGACDWHWLSFPEKRPLYGLNRLRLRKTKLVVEGEKCADAAFVELEPWFDVVSWPGGGKAVSKADWSPFQDGDKVIIWPDCDDKRDKTGAKISEMEQPGWKTALQIAGILEKQGCEVRLVDIPKSGEKPDGWDVADAVLEGLTGEVLRDWIVAHLREPAVSGKTQRAAGATPDGEWRNQLLRKPGKSDLIAGRDNAYLFLNHHPDLAGKVALNEFSNALVTTEPMPWQQEVGEWSDVDDLRQGYWLAQNADMPINGANTIREAVVMVAHERRIHPVRDWLDGVKWDGVNRLDAWVHVCLGAPDNDYACRVGRYFLIMMVARIYRPGCKADTVLVLEGAQGTKKSTALKVLTGDDHFGDTPFVMGDKDSFMALRGKWCYEIAELDSLNRAEVTRAKAFLSSSVDSYRAPYSRSYENHKRQCVFAATTNQYEYLRDLTGNRRFWPVIVGKINLELLAEWREQLFAEAVSAFQAGEPWWPEEDEFAELFKHEIDKRMLDDPWITAINAWMLDPAIAISTHYDGVGVSVLDILSGAIKMEVSKIGAGQQEAKRVGMIMSMLGYQRVKRGPKTARSWVYVQPERVESDEPLPI
jgi:predicted P-loop ATPase